MCLTICLVRESRSGYDQVGGVYLTVCSEVFLSVCSVGHNNMQLLKNALKIRIEQLSLKNWPICEIRNQIMAKRNNPITYEGNCQFRNFQMDNDQSGRSPEANV